MVALLSLVIGLSGCQTPEFDEGLAPVPKGATNAHGTKVTGAVTNRDDVFRTGDTIIITYAGMDPVIPMHQEIIKDDGTITPPEIRSVVAVGRTASEVQAELLTEYKKIYRNPTVTVQPAVRFYHVLGDVNHPGAQQYLGETDMIKAIASAGGLTEFAKKGDIQLRRTGSRKVYHIDYKQALLGNPKHNLPVYPGDTIFVPRSIW
jgi:polysaccharide export outer membrane protein